MKWTRPVETFIGVAVAAWLIDIFFRRPTTIAVRQTAFEREAGLSERLGVSAARARVAP